MARGLGAELLEAAATAHASLVDLARGAYATADRRARAVIDRMAGTSSGPLAFLTAAHVAHAWVALNDLDLKTSEQHVQRVRRSQVGELDVLVDLLTHLVECHLMAHSGKVAEARSYLETPPPSPGTPPRFLRRWYAELRGWLAVLDQDVEQVAVCAQSMRELDMPLNADVVEAVLADLRGDAATCASALDSVLAVTRPGVRQSAATAAAVYRTWMWLRENDIPRARTQLDAVLVRLSTHHRLVLADIGQQPSFLDLVRHAAHDDPPDPAAVELLVVLHGLRQPPRPGPAASGAPAGERPAAPAIDLTESEPNPGLVIDLTSREVDVLRELALGGSYTDIAATLFITENTVKTHLASLYRKLGATRRGEALRAARHAGLLQL
jgi:DNA-binding CsgD family transcriptional regulator